MRIVIAPLVFVLVCACGGGTSSPSPSSAPTPTATAAPSSPATPIPSATASRTARETASPAPAPLAWQRLDPAGGPRGREDHTWTVDEAGASAWLFGGRDGGTAFDDLWRYDLATDEWEQIEPRSGDRPAARFGHGAAWLPGAGLVVWAGQAGTTFFDDLWAFDPTDAAWRRLPSTAAVPPARYGSCLALGPDGRLWISHGFTADAGRFGDTRAWDPATGEWTDETPQGDVPVVRCLHDCLWTQDGRLLLYAGQTTGIAAIGDLWTLDSDGWTRAAEPEPPARQLYAVASTGSTALVFGGADVERRPLGDLWRLDTASLAWTRLEPEGAMPDPRIGATLVADPQRERALLWGGHAGSGGLDDLWHLPIR